MSLQLGLPGKCEYPFVLQPMVLIRTIRFQKVQEGRFRLFVQECCCRVAFMVTFQRVVVYSQTNPFDELVEMRIIPEYRSKMSYFIQDSLINVDRNVGCFVQFSGEEYEKPYGLMFRGRQFVGGEIVAQFLENRLLP